MRGPSGFPTPKLFNDVIRINGMEWQLPAGQTTRVPKIVADRYRQMMLEKEELAAMEGYGCYEFNLLYYERQNTTKIKNLVKQDFIKEIDRAIRAVHGGGNGRRLLVELRNSLNE